MFVKIRIFCKGPPRTQRVYVRRLEGTYKAQRKERGVDARLPARCCAPVGCLGGRLPYAETPWPPVPVCKPQLAFLPFARRVEEHPSKAGGAPQSALGRR
jgi:hypothetical protein